MVSEENPFMYGEDHYDKDGFISILAWAVAHEISHLIGVEHFSGSNNLMGARVPIGDTVIASEEIMMINLKNRIGVTE